MIVIPERKRKALASASGSIGAPGRQGETVPDASDAPAPKRNRAGTLDSTTRTEGTLDSVQGIGGVRGQSTRGVAPRGGAGFDHSFTPTEDVRTSILQLCSEAKDRLKWSADTCASRTDIVKDAGLGFDNIIKLLQEQESSADFVEP